MGGAIDWQAFRTGLSRLDAENLARFLTASDVPCVVEPRGLAGAIEAGFCVLVPGALAHRARWAAAQLPPTEEELVFLATGELPRQES